MSKNLQFICCDVISRLTIDVNILIKEIGFMKQLQKCYVTYEEKQKYFLRELDKKVVGLNNKKTECLLNNTTKANANKINEFIEFIKQVTQIATDYLEKRAVKLKYFTEEGFPLNAYINKLIAFTEHIYSTYYQQFVHQQCCNAFIQLSNQISNILHPELSYADTFEQSYGYLIWSVPFLVNLNSIIDLCINSSNLDIKFLYDQVFSQETNNVELKLTRHYLPTMMLSWLLEDKSIEEEQLETTPIVEDNITKFHQMVYDVTYFLVKITPVTVRNKNPNLVYKGCLDATYSRLSSANVSPLRGIPSSRARGRRWSSGDLVR